MAEAEFFIGQIFEETYPPEAAVWCNSHGDRYITELEKSEEGKRRFQIVAVPEPTLEEVKSQKLAELEQKFLSWYETDAVVTSSLGFVADSDSRAMMDTSGLVTTLEAQPEEARGTVAFMDHNNVSHQLTLEQMKTVNLEIIQNGQSAYAQKWTMRTAIEQAQDVEAVNAISIEFHGEDFSAAS